MTHLVYFKASDGDQGLYGEELWVTDGTPAGTRMVKDINPNNDIIPVFRGSNPQAFADMGDGRVLFRAKDDIFGGRDELWVSDGTPSGTFMVRNIGGSLSSEPGGLTQILPGLVVFAATDGILASAGHTGRELWISDGTPEGTRLLKDLNPGVAPDGAPLSGDPQGFVSLGGGRVLFTADNGTAGRELWVTDGTAAGTRMLADIRNGPGSGLQAGSGQIHDLGNGRALFGADDGTHGYELWITDGTPGGTRLLSDIKQGPAGQSSLTFLPLPDGRVEVRGDPSLVVPNHVVTDGSVAGTVRPGESPKTSLPVPNAVLWTLEGDGYAPQGDPEPIGQLPDGRLLYSAFTAFRTSESYGWGRGYIWVTDGTRDGTRLLVDPDGDFSAPTVNPGLGYVMPTGEIVFNAPWTTGQPRGIWITDGTEAGTRVLSPDVHSFANATAFANGNVLFVGTPTDGEAGLWLTDGTAGGTRKVADGIGSYNLITTDLGYGKWLFSVYRDTAEGPSGALRRFYDIWVSDGTGVGTKQVASGLDLTQMEQITPLGPNAVVFTYSDGVHGREPWVIDFNTASAKLLADIVPGGSSAGQWNLTAVRSTDIPVPTSTLFAERASMQGEPQTIRLDDYFDDPTDPKLDYSVRGLPQGVAFDPAAATIGGELKAAPGTYSVTVVAQNDERGAVASTFDWTVVDTGLLRLASTGGWGREKEGAPIVSAKGSTILIGRKDGLAQMLRIEGGEAQIEGTKLTVKGKVFSTLHPTQKPLMEGSFAIDMKSLAVSDFKDNKLAGDFDLLGGYVKLDFADIAIKPEKIAFATDVRFGGAFAALDSQKAPLSIEIGAGTVAFGPSMLGTGRWLSDKPLSLDLPGASKMTVDFEKIGLFYDLVSDSLYLNGKASLSWGGEVAGHFSFLDPGRTSKLTLDLAGKTPDDVDYVLGDKYLRLAKTAQGWDWDIKGEIAYEGQAGTAMPKGATLVKEMKLELDTAGKQFGGSFKGNLPFLFGDLEVEAAVKAFWNPVQLDGFAFGIDGLNKPLGVTPIFVQGGKLAVENLAARTPGEDPSYSATINVSVGPNTELLPSPVRGGLTGTLKAGTVEVSLALDSKVEYFVPAAIESYADWLVTYFGVKPDDIKSFVLASASGKVGVDFANESITASLNGKLLGDLFTGDASYRLYRDDLWNPAETIAYKGALKFPKALPLVGGKSLSGDALYQRQYDDDPKNDFIAAWSKIDLPVGFWKASVGFGLKVGLSDGSWEILGKGGIPKTGSWDLSGKGLVILSASWDVAKTGVRLELVAPDGTVIPESAFAAHAGITLVEALNDATSRHVALADVAPGVWDLRVANPAGLGTVVTEAAELYDTPVARIDAVEVDAGQAEIRLAPLADVAGARVTLFVSETRGEATGRIIADGLAVGPGAPLTGTWDLAALAPGEWWVHARTEAPGLIPGLDVFDRPIVLAGAADLGITLQEGRLPDTGQRTVTVEVANAGDRASAPGVLSVQVPDALLGGPRLPGFVGFPAAQELALPALAPGAVQSYGFTLPAGLSLPADAILIETRGTGWDANTLDNSLIWYLSDPSASLQGVLTGRDGTPLAGVALSVTRPDGSVLDATTDAQGRFAFDGLDLGAGHLDGLRDWAPGSAPAITTASALEALRMAVGLNPSWGPADGHDFIAADVSGDGRVTTADALDILRVAVGLPSPNPPRWIFVDAEADLSGVTATSVPTGSGIDLAGLPDPTSEIDLMALLVGHVVHYP